MLSGLGYDRLKTTNLDTLYRDSEHLRGPGDYNWAEMNKATSRFSYSVASNRV